MEKEVCLERCQDLIKSFAFTLGAEIESMLSSGMINYQDYKDGYYLPKLIVSSAIERRKNEFMPPDNDRKGKREIKSFVKI